MALNISVSSYAKLEAGDRGINSENCIALADLFGVSCDYILRGIESENIDVCKKTALDQKTLDALIKNKENAVCDFTTTTLDEIYKRMDAAESDIALKKCEIAEMEIICSQAEAEEYSIANSFLNQLIQDVVLWDELRRACGQYISCLTEICYEYKENQGFPSVGEALNQMGLDAAKYIAGQAFGEFFSRTMHDAEFCESVSGLSAEEINKLITLKLLNGNSKEV